jgi:hypothetical protein
VCKKKNCIIDTIQVIQGRKYFPRTQAACDQPWRSLAHTSPMLSILSKRHTVAQRTHKYQFIYTQKIRAAADYYGTHKCWTALYADLLYRISQISGNTREKYRKKFIFAPKVKCDFRRADFNEIKNLPIYFLGITCILL